MARGKSALFTWTANQIERVAGAIVTALVLGGIGVGLTLQSNAMPALSYVGGAFMALGAVAMMGMLIQGAMRYPIRVGAEGVCISGVVRDEVVAFRDVEQIERATGQDAGAVAIVLRSGRRILVGPIVGRMEEGGRAIEALFAAFDTYRARPRREIPLGLVSEGISDATWMSSLREQQRGGGLREGAMDRDELLAVVEDPTTTPSARAAAAFLLRAAMTESERTRVRVAADDVASPKVRVALEAAADEESDEAVVARALTKAR